MKTLLCAVFVLTVQAVVPERGRQLPTINFTDEAGRSRNLSEFAGYPLVLLPMYSRCPSACLRTVAQLKETLGKSSADPTQFRVLLFSFDPGETPTTLAAYRKREAIPLSWSIAAANQKNIDALLDSIGFQAGKASNEFVHPNLLVFVNSKLQVTKWIYGTDFTASDFDAALKVASGQTDWIGRHSESLYSGLLFAAAFLCVLLVQQLLARKVRTMGVKSLRPPSSAEIAKV